MKILVSIFAAAFVTVSIIAVKAKNANQLKSPTRFPDFGYMVPASELSDKDNLGKALADSEIFI